MVLCESNGCNQPRRRRGKRVRRPRLSVRQHRSCTAADRRACSLTYFLQQRFEISPRTKTTAACLQTRHAGSDDGAEHSRARNKVRGHRLQWPALGGLHSPPPPYALLHYTTHDPTENTSTKAQRNATPAIEPQPTGRSGRTCPGQHVLYLHFREEREGLFARHSPSLLEAVLPTVPDKLAVLPVRLECSTPPPFDIDIDIFTAVTFETTTKTKASQRRALRRSTGGRQKTQVTLHASLAGYDLQPLIAEQTQTLCNPCGTPSAGGHRKRNCHKSAST